MGTGMLYPDVGRSDLLPGGLGGPLGVGPGGLMVGPGNLMGPGHPGFGGLGGGLMGGPAGGPTGGARFDPFMPPGVGGFGAGGLGGGLGGGRPGFPRPRGGPDNDLFMPPTGRDDMFM